MVPFCVAVLAQLLSIIETFRKPSRGGTGWGRGSALEECKALVLFQAAVLPNAVAYVPQWLTM